MTTITIPKRLAGQGDLIVLPRKEYEAMKARMVPEYVPTVAERRALARARKNFKAGETLTLDELKRQLAHRD